MRTRLTNVGKLFLALMLLFYVASVTSQSGLLLLFIGLIGGCFVVNWFFARRNVQNVHIIPPTEVFLVEGARASQPWRIENSSKKHIEALELLSDGARLFRLRLVSVEDSISLVPDLTYERRGVFPNAQVVARSAAPYGLLRAERKLDLPGEVVVFPRVYSTSSPAGSGLDVIAGGRFRGGRRVNTGTNFAGVRDWQAGDSIRQIHWNTTARRGTLSVKSFEEELGGRVTLILDTVGSDMAAIDNAVRAAASIGSATIEEGHQLELIDSEVKKALRLPPFSDDGEFLERLARYVSTPLGAALDVDRFWRKSTIAIVGTEWREQWRALVDRAREQNRRVHIYLPERKAFPENVEAEWWSFAANDLWPAGSESIARK